MQFKNIEVACWSVKNSPHCFCGVAKVFTNFSPILKNNVVVVVTQPLPKDGGMAENHGAPEPGQLPRACTAGRKETKSERRKESVTGHCRMR